MRDLLACFGTGHRRRHRDHDRVLVEERRLGTCGLMERGEVSVVGAKNLFESRRQILKKMKPVGDLGCLRGALPNT